MTVSKPKPRPKAAAASQPARPAPSEAEKARIQADARWAMERPSPVRMVWGEGGKAAAEHADHLGHHVRLHRVFGSRSHDFTGNQLGFLENASRQRGRDRGEDEATVNAGLALVSAIAPENELESALAVQIASAHFLASELWGLAKTTDRTDHIELYGNMAVKSARTMAVMTEALAKLRNAGKQTVEVVHVHKHVYVAPGGQAIVGDVLQQGGGGSDQNLSQPHAQALEYAPGAACAPMRSADAGEVIVSGPGGAEPEPLQDARRGKGLGRARRGG